MKLTMRQLVGSAGLLATAPLSAMAATVTVAPATAAAPAIGAPMLALSALAMATAAVFLLRRSRTAVATLAGILALTGSLVAAHKAWAVNTVLIDGEDCIGKNTYEYNGSSGATNLVSLCDGPMRIVALAPCEEQGGEAPLGTPRSESPTMCEVGMVLQEEEGCRLPLCL